MSLIQIGERKLGPGHPTLIIAEVAQAHDGSLNTAHAYLDAIADAGADAIKFQTHIAAAESTKEETFRKSSPWIEESKAEFWTRTGFTEEQWAGLFLHTSERNLIFLCSPFSVEAMEMLERVGVAAWKIASGEVTNFQMFEGMAETKKPIFLSAGMSDWAEQDRVVSFIQGLGAPLALFQCTTAYPCPPEEVGLNLIAELRERYSTPVGLSDHTGAIYSSLAAASLGADMLEVHITLSRELYGTSVDASLTTSELGQLVEGVRAIERMQSNPVDKDAMAASKAHLRPVFFRSVVAREGMAKGTILEKSHMTTKKPGTGISAEKLNDLVGRELLRDVQADQLISQEDLK